MNILLQRIAINWVYFTSLSCPLWAGDPPSVVTAPLKEAELPTLHLTAKAVARLGVVTSEIAKSDFSSTRSYLGSVRWSAGGAADAISPAPFSSVEELHLIAERQLIADCAVTTAQIVLDAAALATRRACVLATAKAGSDRIVEEAAASERQAKANWELATQQRALLGKPVAEVLKTPELWIAVRVPASEYATVMQCSEVVIRPIGLPTAKSIIGKAVSRPITVLPSGSLEVNFSISENVFGLGQPVEVILALKNQKEFVLTVPCSSVIYDATGGSWIYVVVGPESFTRQRVSVARTAGTVALLAAGPPVGTQLVTVGVAELFGAEFGGFK